MKKPTRFLLTAFTVTLFCPFAFVQQPATAAAFPPPADASANPSTGSNVTTSGGTVNALPLWTSSTNVQSSAVSQTGSGGTAKVTVKGTLVIPATGGASAAGGKPSEPINLTTSAFNSDTGTAVGQTFQLRTVPVNNNTSTPSASLDVLFAHGSAAPAETGLKISDKGIISFAPGQQVPGAAIAMLAVTGLDNPIVARCYNGTLDGSAATTPPCGITLFPFQGETYVYFNFEVDNRFISATLNGGSNAIGIIAAAQQPTVIAVDPPDKTGTPTASNFTLFIY